MKNKENDIDAVDATPNMGASRKIGYVVFHRGTNNETQPFYLTKSETAFSANIECAEIYGSPEEARKSLRAIYTKMTKSAPCRHTLGMGRIVFEVVAQVSDVVREEMTGIWKNKELAEALGNDDGKIGILYLKGLYKQSSIVFAIPQNKTLRIRCGNGSRNYYEIDCTVGDLVEWQEHMTEKSWYCGEIKKIADEYIRHFCIKWGNH